MSSVASKVRALARSFAQNVAFTTGQLLCCGTRSAVDTALCRLAKNGVIERLAAGVYRYVSSVIENPSAFEIAKIKAERFGKRIAEYARSDFASESLTFNTDGCSSSFNSIYGRLKLKHLSPAKFNEQARPRTDRSACNAVQARKDGIIPRLDNAEAHLLNEKLEQGIFQQASQLVHLIQKLLENSQRTKRQICYSQLYLSGETRHVQRFAPLRM